MNQSNVLQQFIKTPEAEDPRHYKAFGTYQSSGDRELYIDVRDKNGDGCLVSYSYIKWVKYTADRLVSIVGTDFGITLEGQQLDKLIDPLHDERVRYVQEFNASRFDTPEDGEAVIEKITMTE